MFDYQAKKTAVDYVKGRVTGALDDVTGGRLPKLPGSVGIDGFTMEVRLSESVEYSANVATAVLEDGSAVSDHIALNPLVLSIEAEVSNIYRTGSPLLSAVRKGYATTGRITRFLPERTEAQLQRLTGAALSAYDITQRIEDLIDTGEGLYELINPPEDSPEPLVRQFLDHMLRLHLTKSLARVETGAGVHDNMYLASFRPDTTRIAEGWLAYRATFREIRFAETVSRTLSGEEIDRLYAAPAPAVEAQTAPMNDYGESSKKSILKFGLGDAGTELGNLAREGAGGRVVEYLSSFFGETP